MTTMIKKIGHQITIFQDEKGFLLSTNTKPQIDVLEAKVFHLNQEEYVSTLFTFGGVTLPIKNSNQTITYFKTLTDSEKAATFLQTYCLKTTQKETLKQAEIVLESIELNSNLVEEAFVNLLTLNPIQHLVWKGHGRKYNRLTNEQRLTIQERFDLQLPLSNESDSTQKVSTLWETFIQWFI